MKKKLDEALEKEPLAVGAKILEMKKVSESAVKAVKKSQLMEDIAGQKTAKKKFKSAMVKANDPIPLKIKKTHSLGDFYGKFHPSKSSKGIKRSE